MSGGFGKSQQRSGSTTQIDPTQLGFLQQLWQQGLDLANQQGGQPGQVAGDISNALMPQLMQGIGQLTNNPFLNNLQQLSTPDNAMVQQNVDLLGQDLNRQFSEQLLPQIQSQSIMGGGLGGGRQGVAQGLAAQGVQDAFARGSADIRNQAQQQALQASQLGGNLLGQGIQTGIGAVPNIMNLGLSPFMSAFLPLQQLGGLLGAPTTVGSSFGRGDSFNIGFGRGG